nr:hypothetical protein BaRGS_029727 [Batillaria attramentaria]
MKAASLMKTRTMAVIILVTVGTLQVACLNYLFKMDIYLATDQQTNRSVYQTRLSETYMAAPEVFDFVENVFWAGLIPSCTVVVLLATVLTAIQLRRMAEWRKSSSTEASNKKQTALVKMLAVSVGSNPRFIAVKAVTAFQ